MRFEWDAGKASENFAKHGVTFYEAAEVFYDPNALDDYDAEHSTIEVRFFIIGLSTRRLLFVVYSEPEEDVVRIISARKAGRLEREVMSKKSLPKPLLFSVVEDDGETVTIEISEEDYQRDLAAGVEEDAALKPGRYKMKRGGFVARHPDLKPKKEKRA